MVGGGQCVCRRTNQHLSILTAIALEEYQLILGERRNVRKDEGSSAVNGIYSGGQVLVKSLYIGATGKAVLPMYSRSSRNGGVGLAKHCIPGMHMTCWRFV